MKNADYLRKFEEYLTDEEKSRSTINSYVGDSKEFLKFAKKEIGVIESADVTAFKEHLQKKGLKILSINKKLVGVKQLIDFVNDRFSLGVTARVKQLKVQKQYSLKDDELLSSSDYEKIIKTVEEADDLRAKALFETMFYTGMRISEALQLRVDHVENRVEIISNEIKGKGSKFRDIYIPDELMEVLQEYLKVRKQPRRDDLPPNSPEHTKALFVGERGPISRHTAHRLIKKYAEKANVESQKAHVHNLRHRFCLDLAEEGYHIQDIAKFAGHESIEVTKKYLEKTQSEYRQMLNNRKRKQLS
jgi:integrase/recombinase XerD